MKAIAVLLIAGSILAGAWLVASEIRTTRESLERFAVVAIYVEVLRTRPERDR